MFSTQSRLRVAVIAALAVSGLAAPSARAAHRAGGGRQVCPRGTVRVLVGPHHTRRCIPAATFGLGATRTGALRSSVLRLALVLRPKGVPLASVRQLANATVSELLGAERRMPGHASTRAVAAAASPAVTEIPAPPGQFGAGTQLFTSDPGAGSSTTIYHSAFANECPAPNGHVNAAAAHDEHAVRTIALPASTPGADMRMQMSVDAEVTVKAIGHNGENGKLQDYDAVANTLTRIKLGLLGPNGLTRGSVRTAQRTSRMTFTQLVPPTRGTIASRMISATMQGSGGNWPIVPGDPHDYVLGLESMFKAFDGLDADAFPKAQHHWYDDAGCLTIMPDPAKATLRPGHVQDVKVRVKSAATGGDAPTGLSATLGAAAHGTLTPAKVNVAPASPGTVHYTAPTQIARASTDTITFDGTSVQGRAHRDITFQLQPDDFPIYFKVTAAELDTHADGHVTTAPNACTGLGYPQQSSTDAHGDVIAPNMALGALDEVDGGTLAGGINAYLVGVTMDRHSTGCAYRSDGSIAACSGTSHDTLPRVQIGFSITADSRNAANATLTWIVPPPDAGVMGVMDGGDYCQTQALTGGANPSGMTQQIPLANLLSPGPHAFLFNGTSSWNDNGRQLGYTYNLAVYVERVDANGKPL